MITFALPLSAGNAVRLFLQTPARAMSRVLRRTDAAFVGPTDPNAEVICVQTNEPVVLDVFSLENGTEYFYHDYTSVDGGTTWADGGATVTATPAAIYEDAFVPVQQLLRDRLAAGLAVEVARGTLIPESGKISVYTAPFILADGQTFPVVSVHLDTTAPAERALGEEIDADLIPGMVGGIGEVDGWMARVRLAVIGVSLNGDERNVLREAIRRVVQANLTVFDNFGIIQISFSQTDDEQFPSQEPVQYRAVGSFECLAPAAVTSGAPAGTQTLGEFTFNPSIPPGA